MPVLSHTNTSSGPWPTNHLPQPGLEQDPQQSKLQALLFNIITILLSAATLVMAALHFWHQRKKATNEQEYEITDHPLHRFQERTIPIEQDESAAIHNPSAFVIGGSGALVDRVQVSTTCPLTDRTHSPDSREQDLEHAGHEMPYTISVALSPTGVRGSCDVA